MRVLPVYVFYCEQALKMTFWHENIVFFFLIFWFWDKKKETLVIIDKLAFCEVKVVEGAWDVFCIWETFLFNFNRGYQTIILTVCLQLLKVTGQNWSTFTPIWEW